MQPSEVSRARQTLSIWHFSRATAVLPPPWRWRTRGAMVCVYRGRLAPPWIDATCVKPPVAGRTASVAATISIGAKTVGRREVPGMRVGAAAAGLRWTSFPRSPNHLGRRGLKPVNAAGWPINQPPTRTISTARSGTW